LRGRHVPRPQGALRPHRHLSGPLRQVRAARLKIAEEKSRDCRRKVAGLPKKSSGIAEEEFRKGGLRRSREGGNPCSEENNKWAPAFAGATCLGLSPTG